MRRERGGGGGESKQEVCERNPESPLLRELIVWGVDFLLRIKAAISW
ncbi:MAG: hypothetical protein LBP76_11195 [Treponema sp.]|jgi:hypothetical protein|nr:hypothetical protein [Treponema sp.]